MSFRLLVICSVLLFSVAFASTPATGKPIAYYNPLTGNIRIKSDYFYDRDALFIISKTSQFTTDMDAFAEIPGAIFGGDDLPMGFYYLDFPIGEHEIGNVVVPGTPASDLYSYDVQTIEGLVPGVEIVSVPEPASVGMVIAGAILLVSRQRRASRQFSR